VSTYKIELWDKSLTPIADITKLATDRKFTIGRNAAETLEFTLNLTAFERHCANVLGADPNIILEPLRTNAGLRRNGAYMFGTEIYDCSIDDGQIKVSAHGYLNLTKDRYVYTTISTPTDLSQIARTFIDLTNTPGGVGDPGLSLAPNPYLTGVMRTGEYLDHNIKEGVVALANTAGGSFDFYFTYGKQFVIVQHVGERRPDVAFYYGGPHENCTFSGPRSGENVGNEIIANGGTVGGLPLRSVKADYNSRLEYFTRTKLEQFPLVKTQAELDAYAEDSLAANKDLLKLPQIKTTGKVIGSKFIQVGDRVPLYIENHPYLAGYAGLYRVEKLEVTLDANDFESEIIVTLDNAGVFQNEVPGQILTPSTTRVSRLDRLPVNDLVHRIKDQERIIREMRQS